MDKRTSIAYVVNVDENEIVLNIKESHKGQITSHAMGISSIGQLGDLLLANGGFELIVLRIISISFDEPREAHIKGVGTENLISEPLRHIKTKAIGRLIRNNEILVFVQGEYNLPSLGAEVFPLTNEELEAILYFHLDNSPTVTLGNAVCQGNLPIKVNVHNLLSRHFAILGSTGQGKTHFIAALLQKLLDIYQKPRIVIFDVNGEYNQAFQEKGGDFNNIVIGSPKKISTNKGTKTIKIPYYALGRQGLCRLLLPSERSQYPALRFAIEHLSFVEADENGARLAGSDENIFFDDCRSGDANCAFHDMQKLREKNNVNIASNWPHMRAIACLAAEWYALSKAKSNNYERNYFQYGHVSPLINRIRGFIEDEQFCNVIDVNGGKPINGGIQSESQHLIEKIFGNQESSDQHWVVNVVDLSNITEDLLPYILGALLELFSAELFRKGPGNTYPTVLVLEEAHHYLKQYSTNEDILDKNLAYERLAKEGRKYGLSLICSTQRPAELSSTVLAQCGTWCVFRLTNEIDQRSVASASESSERFTIKQIPSLPRGEAIVFGAAMPLPTRITVIRPTPEPNSSDSDYTKKWGLL